MKSKRLIVYLGGAVLVVVSFWGTMATVQKSRRGNTGAPATPSEAAGQKSQGQDIPQSTGVAPKVSSADNRNWWGVNVRARTLQVDPDEPPVQAAEVTEIRPGSPAATAGLHVGDAIVGLNRQPLAGSGQLESGVGSVAFGGKLTVDLIRAGEPVELTLTRGEATSGGGLAQAGQAGSPVPAAGGANPQSRSGIFINGQEISQQQVGELRALYGYVAPPGKYWYDSRGGLFGAMGYEAAGFMRPGHDFGPLPANASNGTTGVFINGRQINMNEAMYCQRLFGAVYQGRWWLDGRTGNMGAEGNPTPIVNVFAALRQSQQSGQGGSYGWHSNITGASGGSSGGCSYVSIPGSGTVSAGNCD